MFERDEKTMLENSKKIEMFRRMCLIRVFETKAIKHYKEKLNRGPLHVYLGEEACAVGSCMALEVGDYITSTHRGHGHCIAMGGDVKKMLAEICGRATGYCKGKGGSMHIADLDLGIIGANGIVGAGLPIAVGAAIALDNMNRKNVILCFFGDGASNTGAFHEALNMASIWKLPVIFFCENNCYAISTCTKDSLNIKNISVRSASYGIPGMSVDGNDVLEVYAATCEARSRALNGGGPTLIEARTYRTIGHWIGDPIRYRTKDEEEWWKTKCPIKRFRRYLIDTDIISEEQATRIEQESNKIMEEANRFAVDSPDPQPDEALEDIYV
jgi:TPP-dependent pyruvate/acetoin dehydrogenase alpha subunit